MPCYDDRSDNCRSHYQIYYPPQVQGSTQMTPKLVENLLAEAELLSDFLLQSTRAACDMRTILRRHGLEGELTVETREWIGIHDAQDARRIKIENENGTREKTRNAALDKLNLDERRVLGL